MTITTAHGSAACGSELTAAVIKSLAERIMEMTLRIWSLTMVSVPFMVTFS